MADQARIREVIRDAIINRDQVVPSGEGQNDVDVATDAVLESLRLEGFAVLLTTDVLHLLNGTREQQDEAAAKLRAALEA